MGGDAGPDEVEGTEVVGGVVGVSVSEQSSVVVDGDVEETDWVGAEVGGTVGCEVGGDGPAEEAEDEVVSPQSSVVVDGDWDDEVDGGAVGWEDADEELSEEDADVGGE